MIDRLTIDKIFEAARVEEVVGDFVSLKKRGANLLGLCPFHNEKTPSFNVSPSRGIYKCFGCGKGGNSVNFIMEHEHLTYPEALRFLAKKYHIEIEEKEETPEEIQAHNEKESLMLVSGFAQQFFTETLLETEDGKAIGMSYFRERGFNLDTVAKFQLGYSPEKRTALAEAATSKGYKSEYLEASGLCVKREEGGLFDRFFGRVMFPIHNVSGRVIAFGGRTLKTDKKVAKYINSPESAIYHKSNVLYGIYFAKNKIVANDNCFLVEGYTDVISMHSAGIENVVASSGTSLTVEQIRLIKRYTKNITILYDGDAAGIKASFRGINLVLEEGMNVKVVLFPEGDDPDSYSKKVSGEEMKEFIKRESKDFISFKTGLLLQDTQHDPIKKADLIREIMETISLIPDAISRNIYTTECSRIMGVDEQLLISELNKLRRKNFTKNLKDEEAEILEHEAAAYEAEQQPVSEKPVHDFEDQERTIIRVLITYGDKVVMPAKAQSETGEEVDIQISVAEFIYHDLSADSMHFDNLLYQLIFNEMAKALNENIIPDEKFYVQNPDSKISSFAAEIISSPYTLSHNWLDKHKIHTNLEDAVIPKSVKHAIYSLKVKHLMKRISETEALFASAADEEEVVVILEQYKQLLELKKRIATEELGRVVLK